MSLAVSFIQNPKFTLNSVEKKAISCRSLLSFFLSLAHFFTRSRFHLDRSQLLSFFIRSFSVFVFICVCVYKFDEWPIKYIKSIIPMILGRLSGLIVPSVKCDDGNGPTTFIYCITLIWLFRESIVVRCCMCARFLLLLFSFFRLTIFSIRFYALLFNKSPFG